MPTAPGKKPAMKKKGVIPPALPADYVSPAKKRRKELDKCAYRDVGTIGGTVTIVIDSPTTIRARSNIIDDCKKELKDFIKRGMPPNEKVTFYARFLWKKKHIHASGKIQWRLHFYDTASDNTFDELMDIYHNKYDDDRAAADRDLATVSIWEDWDGKTNCPVDGAIVKFKHFTGLQMYQGEALQFSTRVDDMEF
ncbi:hypothetical protein DVH05_017224 [Phytophthora capsici]|nr:hypothetical protein DVH05_017224 [Phytophthora capsici]